MADTELPVSPDAQVIRCPDCGSELLGDPNYAQITHNADGSHTWSPEAAADPT